eukprot:gene10646-12326_t
MSLMKKVALVTGSTDGIGKHTATLLARDGYRVLLHGRSEARLSTTKSEILSKVPDADLHTYCHDLSTLSESKGLARAVLDGHDRLDVLINNAGVFQEKFILTPDNLESSFAINVAATYILGCMLLPMLQSTESSRILNVASISQGGGNLRMDNLQYQKGGFSNHSSYSLSKLCVAAFSHELALRTNPVEDALVVSCDPGTVNTKMLLAGWGPCGIKVADANDQYRLMTDPFNPQNHGKYYVHCRESSLGSAPQVLGL